MHNEFWERKVRANGAETAGLVTVRSVQAGLKKKKEEVFVASRSGRSLEMCESAPVT